MDINYHSIAYNIEFVASFMDRSLGSWLSNRIYRYFDRDGKITKEQNITTNLTVLSPQPYEYEIKYSSSNGEKIVSKGSLDFVISFVTKNGEVILKRTNAYLRDEPTVSRVEFTDDYDRITTITEYDGKKFVENIRFANDFIRIRDNTGYDENGLYLVGQYFETKVTVGE